ncbi:MAG TPA: ABC transporter ATP-binding protein [Terriglobales bacterium]|nr:ABC transporter ATP-binding protein [Terriglobales bacterium]
MVPVIELDNLMVRLGGRTILDGLKASVQGRAIGLLGPNGSGKSTLINTLLGFYPPDAGTARIFGRDIRTEAKQLRSLIGYMPESDSFIAEMTGIRFVRYMAELSGLPAKEAMERAHEAFFYVGLGEQRYRKVGTYSLGMKQMAKLAQAIVHGPKLLFLDEPTNGLDPPARLRMINLIREIRETHGMHLILSSHLLRDVEECCEEVLILKDGRIADYCNLEEERKANRKFIEIETFGANGEFSSAIEALGCECAWLKNGRAKLVLPPTMEMREIYRAAAKFDVQIRKMNYRRDSLEDIFLRAMDSDQPLNKVEQAHGSL